MRKVLLAIVAVFLVIAPTAAGAVIIPEATFRTERVYFQCVGDVKVQNVARLDTPTNPWSTAAPTLSVQDGAGCGHFEYGLGGAQFDLVFEGTFAGNIDALTVHLHALATTDSAAFPAETIAKLSVDGMERLVTDGAQPLVVTEENSGVTIGTEFSITGLNQGTEEGDGTRSRTFRLTISSPVRSTATWVWDTTEVPAGITFNPTSLASTVFPAN
jgi:hypothetical protein